MKKIIKISFSITSLIFVIFFLIILYDLSSYDSSYVNRSSFTISENNLNSKRIKKIFKKVEKIYYILGYKLFDTQKEFWKIEDPKKRESLPKTIIIPAKVDNFLPGTKIKDIEKNYSNWMRSHGGYSSMRFSNLNEINKSNVDNLKVA